MNDLIMYIIVGVISFCLVYFLFWPLFKSSEVKLKTTVRDFNIKQIKHSIKKLDITKKELFDE